MLVLTPPRCAYRGRAVKQCNGQRWVMRCTYALPSSGLLHAARGEKYGNVWCWFLGAGEISQAPWHVVAFACDGGLDEDALYTTGCMRRSQSGMRAGLETNLDLTKIMWRG